MHAVLLFAGTGSFCTGHIHMFTEEAHVANSTNVAIDSTSWHVDLMFCCSRFARALDRSFRLVLRVSDRLLHASTGLPFSC